MKKRQSKKAMRYCAMFLAAAILGSAASNTRVIAATTQEAEQSVNAMSLIGKYDSADTATIVAVDLEQQLIRLFNHDRGRTYTLSYDNTSMIFDSSINALSARLLEPGMIVDLTFLKSSRHLNSMVVSPDAFSYEDVSDYDLNAGVNTARIFGKFYRLTPMTLVLADGEQIPLSAILPADSINVRGVGDEIYAITIAKGHGYISLSSDRVGDIDLVGGWLELGSSYIRRITPGMYATVPEGTYELRIEGEGFDFTDEVTITRNRETVVDVSQISSSNARVGTVIFNTTPEDAAVYVDGERAMNGVEQHYSIGIHPLRVEADGHTTMNAYLKVGRQQATINLNLRQTSASASSTGATTTSSQAQTAASYATTDAASYASSIYGGETWGSSTGSSMTGVYTTPAPTSASTALTTASNGNATNGYSNPTGGTWSNAGSGATNGSGNGATATGGAATNASAAATTSSAGNATRGNTTSPGWVETDPNAAGNDPGGSGANGGWVETDPNASTGGVWVETDPDAQAVNGRRVTVATPQGAQLYLDGAYVGVTPTYFEKVPGLHTVTLRMNGYVPQTYTISVDSNDDNRTYNFPALLAQP